jgi:hypothetical protein
MAVEPWRTASCGAVAGGLISSVRSWSEVTELWDGSSWLGTVIVVANSLGGVILGGIIGYAAGLRRQR